MLRDLLDAVAAADGAVRPADLARGLGVDPAVVEGMLAEARRLGRLAPPGACSLTGGGCARTCPGPAACPLVARLPEPLSPQRPAAPSARSASA